MSNTKPASVVRQVLHNWIALAVLGVCVLGVAWLFFDERNSHELAARERLHDLVQELALKISSEMRTHEQMLRGVAGLFEVGGDVKRATFAGYVEHLALQPQFPGILSIGYAPQLARADIPALEARLRAEGRANFRVYPVSPSELQVPVAYIEPPTALNRSIAGFDMFSERVRREALESARDSGRATLSGPVTLLQDKDTAEPAAGLVLYLPVYRRGMPIETLA
jgi:CHASE1-domain containing sensor protein